MVGAAMMRGQAKGGHAIARCCLQLKFLSWLGGLWRRAPLLAGKNENENGGSQATTALLKQNFGMDLASCVLRDDQRVKSQDTKSRVKTKGWRQQSRRLMSRG